MAASLDSSNGVFGLLRARAPLAPDLRRRLMFSIALTIGVLIVSGTLPLVLSSLADTYVSVLIGLLAAKLIVAQLLAALDEPLSSPVLYLPAVVQQNPGGVPLSR